MYFGYNINRFYFGKGQEEVLGQLSEQGISAPTTEGLSVYQWSVLEKKNMMVEEMPM